ncbi:cation diffusion facilitator family transporter [Rubinisphaera margarita]|uniref:cation diffusion facilitator family transporter n=1 Tax=Rubinisphaera margarita TaxID=2909586 RepID=UPI001EE7E2B1|nr:cation diffusion facilitator family transporter [Rubinisphaera margarita]MCG6154251.1 cation diffusion facilitator family transporter [Rubinisphaera margarita]
MHDHAHHFHYNRAFRWGVSLNVFYVLVEAGFGFQIGSLALLSDAGHNLGDVLGLLLAWSGHALSQIPPSSKRTYGYQSATILAALFNALILLMATGGIVWEAIGRFQEPSVPDSQTVIIVAGIGVVVNFVTTLLFVQKHDHDHDLNIRGAFLHMAADTGVSLGVVIGGIVIYYTGWTLVDPVLSLLIAALILWGTWGLLTESVNMAMQAVPQSIDLHAVAAALRDDPGVTEVHDLHVWAMSTTNIALTAHVIRPDSTGDAEYLREMSRVLREKFKIRHTTIQIDRQADAPDCQAHSACNMFGETPRNPTTD